MSPTRYFLVQHDDAWMIKFADEEFGPYKSKSEAMLFAVDAARKLGERGADDRSVPDGRERILPRRMEQRAAAQALA